ncbi:hypothetical protein Goarm_000673 [Gossypium armourianum]|uniref:Uncharacterized protein n=1 Tax=Gossypium armourianum TaxID=34283 RepID=A0A7J9KAJ5_9ROSI|nr:hypothetical protein [Gossypium armourianum]
MSSSNQCLASSTEKRPSVAGLQSMKLGSAAKNRVALGDKTNQGNGCESRSRALQLHFKGMLELKVILVFKVPFTSEVSKDLENPTSPATPMSTRDPLECLETTNEVLSSLEHREKLHEYEDNVPVRAPLECLESFDDILPSFGSLESPELEYLESEDASVSESIETKAVGNLMRERLKQKEK